MFGTSIKAVQRQNDAEQMRNLP